MECDWKLGATNKKQRPTIDHFKIDLCMFSSSGWPHRGGAPHSIAKRCTTARQDRAFKIECALDLFCSYVELNPAARNVEIGRSQSRRCGASVQTTGRTHATTAPALVTREEGHEVTGTHPCCKTRSPSCRQPTGRSCRRRPPWLARTPARCHPPQ